MKRNPGGWPVPCRVAPGGSGEWSVSHFTISKKEAEFANLRAAIGHPRERVEAGEYTQLRHAGEGIVMSNTRQEWQDHWDLDREARKETTTSVLIHGLGLGLALDVVLQYPHVHYVAVVEKSEDVLNLVRPAFKKEYTQRRVDFFWGDALIRKPMPGEKYSIAWHDIWTALSEDNLADIRLLKRRWAHRCRWQGAWGEEEVRILHDS